MNNNFDELVTGQSGTEEKQPKTSPKSPQMSTEEKIAKETYTEAELNDVNNIIVTVPDQKTPVVVFFGSP